MSDLDFISAISQSILAVRKPNEKRKPIADQEEASIEPFALSESKPNIDHITNPFPEPERPDVNRYQFPDIVVFNKSVEHFEPEPEPEPEKASDQHSEEITNDNRRTYIPFSILRNIVHRSRERELAKHQPLRDQHQQAGYKEGFEAGHKIGYQSAYDVSLEKHNQTAEKWTTLIGGLWNEIQDIHASAITNIGEALLELVANVSEQIVCTELSTSREGIQALIESSIRQLPDAIQCQLTIHPDDKALLTPVLEKLPGISLKEDDAITPGGFHLASEQGDIDATVEHRSKNCIATVHQTLLETLPTP